jgi:peptidoglycan/LPS O-acetylase OafA/YrhL
MHAAAFRGNVEKPMAQGGGWPARGRHDTSRIVSRRSAAVSRRLGRRGWAFVISGYLTTSLTATERQAGKFTLAGFYERRARRILPEL